MLVHASFPAHDPERAARVVAELWRGRSFRFPVFPSSHVAVKGDERGTIVEFYPAGQALVPGPDGVVWSRREAGPSETHLAIGTELDEAAVHAIGRREGWRTQTFSRGPFRVIELWVDDRFLIEVLTPEMQAEYLAFANFDGFAALAAQADVA
jgi:hypothetical protein